MDFDLSEEQKLLKQSAHDFLSKECPRELVRKLEAGDEEFPPALWKKMAGLGWMGLVIPEEYGGSGGSFLDLVMLFEEIGYNICPGPLFSNVVFGSLPILMAGSREQKKEFLPGIARGEITVTMALTEPSASYDPSSIHVKATAREDKYTLSGTKLFVPYATDADYLLCVAKTGEKKRPEKCISIFIVKNKIPGITITSLTTLAGDRQCEVVFDDVTVATTSILGTHDKGWPIVEAILENASVVSCAEMIGGAQAVMDMSLQYARERTQFNRPIGSFQVIQNYFADMWSDISAARYLLHKAAWKISEGIDAGMDVAMAKSRTGEAYRRVTTLGHQIFGGIGFTKEHDMHLFHERSITGDLNLGQGTFHRERIAKRLGL